VTAYCFAAPIQPGKYEAAARLYEELRGPRRSEYEESRRLRINREAVWFQSTPQGEMAVVYWEVDDPRTALQEFAQSEDSFDQWLKERVQEIYGFDPSHAAQQTNERVFDEQVR
jgi:hypothetical protein